MKVFEKVVFCFLCLLLLVGVGILSGASWYDVKSYFTFIGSNTTPATPASGMFNLFMDTGGNLTILDSSGNTTVVGSGSGDMLQSVYDTNADNVVDLAANATHATSADTATSANTATTATTATSATTATTATAANALSANGANCSAGQAPLGVDASGAVESCWTPQADLSLVKGTYTNGYLCTYTTSGTVLNCNTNPASYQAADADLTTYAGITPSATIQTFLGSANSTAARTNLGLGTSATLDVGTGANQIVQLNGSAALPAVDGSNLTGLTSGQVANSLAFSGSPTVGHLAQVGADNTIVDGGTKVTDNASNSTYLYKDASGNITSATLGNGLSDSAGTLSLVVTAIDGSANASITAAQMKGLGVVVSNFGQTTADVRLALPVAEAGLSGLFNVGTAQASNHWGVLANTNDKIYLIAANGTVTAGNDNEAVVMTAAQVGQSFACWTFKTGSSAYDWLCKAISIGTSTFAAHALY